MTGAYGRAFSMRVAPVLATVAVVTLLVAACGQQPEEEAPAVVDAEPATDQDEPAADININEEGLITVDLAITVTSVMSPIPFAVAQDQGFFEEEGVQIGELAEAQGGSTTLNQVVEGELHMGDVATGAVIEAFLGGTPVKVVGSSHQGPYDFTWSTQPDSGIDSVEEMVGKRWGVTNPGSATHDMSYVVADAAGLNIEDFERVFTDGMGGGIALLEAGEIDLALITPLALRRSPRAISPRLMQWAQDPDNYELAFESLDYIESYQKSVFITHGGFAEENPEAVRGVLAALNRAFEFVRENPEESARIYDEQSDIYDYETLLSEIELANDRGALEGGVGFNVAGLESVGVGLRYRAGIEAIPWSEIFDPSFLPEGVATEIPEG